MQQRNVPVASDGAGFVYVPFSRESKAHLINNDTDAWRAADGNNEACLKSANCDKSKAPAK